VAPPSADVLAATGDEEGAAEADAAGTEHADAEAAAVEAAKSWLALVDAGEYGKSWEAAAPLFKGAVDEAAWGKQLGPVRGPLGAVRRGSAHAADTTPQITPETATHRVHCMARSP